MLFRSISKLDALVSEGKFVWSLQWVPANGNGECSLNNSLNNNSNSGECSSNNLNNLNNTMNNAMNNSMNNNNLNNNLNNNNNGSEGMITVHQALWNLNYQSLLYYCDMHGHYNVPYHYSQSSIGGHPTPLHLGYWLHR